MVYHLPLSKLFLKNYTNSSCYVKLEEGNTEYFEIETGVRQGCILSPFLFLLVVDFIMRKGVGNLKQGN